MTMPAWEFEDRVVREAKPEIAKCFREIATLMAKLGEVAIAGGADPGEVGAILEDAQFNKDGWWDEARQEYTPDPVQDTPDEDAKATENEAASLHVAGRRIRYGVRITSWRGRAPGAVHWYGEAWRYDGDTIERGSLERSLDDAGAARFNEIDGTWDHVGSFRWRAGMTTNRFDTEEEVITVGLRCLAAKYGALPEVEVGSPEGLENETRHVASILQP